MQKWGETVSEPTQKDYQDYLRGCIQANEERIKELETSMEHVLARLHQLEEKERMRSSQEHDEHERDVS